MQKNILFFEDKVQTLTVILKEEDKNKEYFINKINKYKDEHELITKKKFKIEVF